MPAILLVEDDEVDIMNVQRAFKKNNMPNTLYIARNGLEALDILRDSQKTNPFPRIVLLDINMPKMNGIEFLREVRNDPKLKSLSVFVMTTSNQDNDKIAAYDLAVAGYILKPLSFEKLSEAFDVLKTYWKLCEQPE